MGPFARDGISYIHKKSRWTGRLLVEENGAKIIQTLAQCGVLSASQIVILSGCSKSSKSLLPRLVGKGYLDCYEGDHVPKLYSLSEKGAEITGRPYRVWDTAGLLRLAAANQFWLQIKKVWPDSLWNTAGEYPVLEKAGVKYAVLSPRQGQVDRVLALRHLNKCQDRVFIVAPDEIYAREIAVNCPPGRMVRYTWDDELRDGLTLYLFHLGEKVFIEDAVFDVDRLKKRY